MSADSMIMITIGLITLCIIAMIVWDIATRDSFYDAEDDDAPL